MRASLDPRPSATVATAEPPPGTAATLVDAIADQAGGSGRLRMLDVDGRVAELVSWRELHERAGRMAAVLARHGVRPGVRVGLLGETSATLVTALQAVWLTGAAVVILPPAGIASRRAHERQVRAVLADARVDLLVCDAGPDWSADPGTPVVALAELADRAARTPPAVPNRPGPGDLALLQYTSGSTRSPRGVPVSHGHLAANIGAIKAALDHEGSHPSRMLSWLPLYHDMGLVGFLCMPMGCGCDLLLQSPSGFVRNPAGWLHAISRHRATMSGAPNFAYALAARLLAGGGSTGLDLGSLRCLVSGGEPVDPVTMTRLAEGGRRFGLDAAAFTPAYGLAETVLAATISPVGGGVRVDRVDVEALERDGRAIPSVPGRAARELVRVGRPVPGTSVRVVDRRTGEPAGEREVGLVELRGPSVVGHYWPDPPPPPGHWLRTGDLGYVTGGELVICGRVKDVIFAAGRNVFPQDIEVAASEVPGVRAGGTAAFGLPGEAGDRLFVVVETRTADPGPVRRSVATAVYAETGLTPAEVVTVPYGGLPRTTSGKLRRTETRERYQSGVLHRESP
jgi:fatty-acyl-CoA synthase